MSTTPSAQGAFQRASALVSLPPPANRACKTVRAFRDDAQISPTSTTGATRGALSPSSTVSSVASVADRRQSDLTNHRRDLSVLESARNPSHGGGGVSMASSLIAPWMSASVPASSSSRTLPTSFYNDSSDSLSVASQFSPGLPPGGARPGPAPSGAQESPDAAFFNTDARRPSAASIATTASSQGSKASGARGGFRKLQGFFGEEFPGRDSSESSLPTSIAGKDQRSRSYSHSRPSHRDRNFSNATDPRDASPSSSRPRTPVPAPEVVPFLYQDNTVRSLLPLVPMPSSPPSHT